MNDAVLDQVASGVKNLAKILWIYQEELMKQGFSGEEAFTLALHYQTQMLINVGNSE